MLRNEISSRIYKKLYYKTIKIHFSNTFVILEISHLKNINEMLLLETYHFEVDSTSICWEFFMFQNGVGNKSTNKIDYFYRTYYVTSIYIWYKN